MKYHKCKPVWLVAIVEGDDQPADDAYKQVRAVDMERFGFPSGLSLTQAK